MPTLAYAQVSYTEADGVAPDVTSLGSWGTVDINTEDFDPDSIVSVASSQFTLAAGTYIIEAVSGQVAGSHCRSRIYDATGAAAKGDSVNCFFNGIYKNGGVLRLLTLVTPGVTTAYELQQMRYHNSSPSGYEQNSKLPPIDAERYSTVHIWKVTA